MIQIQVLCPTGGNLQRKNREREDSYDKNRIAENLEYTKILCDTQPLYTFT